MKRMEGEEWANFIAGRFEKASQNSQHYCSLEKHWHPAGLEFLRIYRALDLPPLAFQLYLYMLIRSSPFDGPRVKNAHLHGDTIQKGEFFENKVSVADFFGKGELEEKAKINWFLRTVSRWSSKVWSRKSSRESVDSTRPISCTTFVICRYLKKALQNLMRDGHHIVSH